MTAGRALLTALAVLLLSTGTSAATPSMPGAARMCDDIAAGHLTVEPLGDSILAEYGATQPARGWAHMLDATLTPTGGAVWMGAVSGSYVGDYLPGGQYYYHVQFVGNAHPSVVMMDWRINDNWVQLSPSEFRARYQQVIDIIRAASPTSTLIIVNPPIVPDTRIDNSPKGPWTQRDYINVLWDLKVANSTLWLDFSHYFPATGQDYAALYSYDLVHPGDPGQIVMYTATHERLTATCG